MGILFQDLRYALRMLAKNPSFTAVAVLTLALGIGANTAVFTVVKGVLLNPLPFPEASRLFLISYRHERGFFGDTRPGLTDAHYLEFQGQNRAFERIATFGQNFVTVTGAGDAIRVSAPSVTSSFFPVLGASPEKGRTFLPEEEQPGRDGVVLLSERELWRSFRACQGCWRRGP